ncbi:MAG: ChbG/HpnK family deacetylase [Prolixibacteraceae bacterium]|nr:ChbG/HpnK family deacetylase [Prolixibacteraceae bacterium]
MKKILLLLVLCLYLFAARSQQKSNPRLIVRGDDMGSSQSSNLASMDTYKNGIETSIEVMVVAPWFPEAARLLRENPGIDVGLHLTITSEWDNIKWRPLTVCPDLTDRNGYFLPMMGANPNYPGLAITENKWKLEEIEKEFRAQIEMALKNVPHVSHMSGHMGSSGFDKKVAELTRRLAAEYNLADVSTNPKADFGILGVGYNGSSKTFAEKETSFIQMLNKLEAGKTYVFVDHPALDNVEMQAVHHIGYENVATDRQGVTDLFKSDKVKAAIQAKDIKLISYNDATKALPRSTPEAENINPEGISNYFKAVKESGQDLHSLMILRHGKVVAEQWFGDNAANKNHVMHSVSKTYTATAIGFCVAENRLKVTDKVTTFFPNDLPATVSPNLAELQIRDLLTMSVGHNVDPTGKIRTQDGSWEKMFLALPIEHKPGTKFVYNSLATYVLSAIVQKVTGEKVIDYLYPRLFRPLGIVGAKWEVSPTGINTGGWGLYIKTEDMAKMGQFMLQKGKWNGKQLLPTAWFDEATAAHITQPPVWFPAGGDVKDSDWVQGYGYQLWRCRHNAFRADGANGQFIIVLPEKDAVIVTTANITDMQSEINLIWNHLLPALK